MKPTILILAFALSLAASQVTAATCFADYKAKQDDPLRLHYGVAEISGPCTAENAKSELSKRLHGDGWTLLNVLGVFGPEGLDERKSNAGPYYLRF